MSKKYFVTGIDTEIGKTICSAILVEYLQADYWKPVQAGELDFTDSHKIEKYAANAKKIFPERYCLNTPASPHLAASIDSIDISLSDFELPNSSNNLIVEGAGGLMVPLNDKDMIIDLAKQLNLETILVTKHYLGSINHTILSVKALQNYKIPIKGILVNGPKNESSESAIESITGEKIIGHIPTIDSLDPVHITKACSDLQLDL